jgi:hypothetical protein
MDKLGFTAIYQSPSLSSQPEPIASQPSVSPPEIALASLNEPGIPENNPAETTETTQTPPTHSYSSLTPEERATVEEIRRRQTEGAEVILIVNPARKGTEKVQSEIIKLENVSENFLDVLLERDRLSADSGKRHPTLTEQAAAMNRRSIAAPAETVRRQQETSLRTQKTIK